MDEKYSPNTALFAAEFQGGSGTGFGNVNEDACNALVNQESVRVLWKNNYALGIKGHCMVFCFRKFILTGGRIGEIRAIGVVTAHTTMVQQSRIIVISGVRNI